MKISKIIYSIVLSGIIIGLGSCSMFKKSTGADGIILQYKLSEGQTVVMSSEVVTKMETEQMGQTMALDMNATTVITNKVLASSAEGMELELEFTKMMQSMESPMGSQDTDFSELTGKKVSYKLNPLGEVSDEKGFEDLPSITNASGETLDGDMFKQVASSSFIRLPDHPVKLGDSWTNADTTDMPYGGGNLKTTTSTTYLVIEKLEVEGMKCLKIDISGKSKTEGNFEQNGMELGLERNAATTGHMIFAYEKGMYLSQELTGTTDGIVDVPAAGMTIPQKIVSTTKTTVTL